MNEYINLLAEVAALRQRAEAAERECVEAKQEARDHLLDLCAERNLKRIAFQRLDEVRTVVEETIIPALEGIHANRLMDDVETCACGSCSQCLTRVALAAARKTLEDEQREEVTT